MTCPGCERDVTLLGGFCGHCGSKISRAVNEAIEGLDVLDGSVVDVFEVSNPGFPDAHYAVFHDELVVKPIKSSCPPFVCGDCGSPAECDCDVDTAPGIVLDPFTGRGTVGKVAAKHGRRHVLIDLDPESVDLANDYVPRERNGVLSAYTDGGGR